jgi:hypothetical protein
MTNLSEDDPQTNAVSMLSRSDYTSWAGVSATMCASSIGGASEIQTSTGRMPGS